jgi:putative transposase
MWRAQLLQGAPGVFSGRADQSKKEGEALRDQLYQQIGQLKVELDWLKKKWGLSANTASARERVSLIERTNPQLSVSRQCELLGIPRFTVYYEPKGESEENKGLMRLLDEQYTQTPFYGVRRMTAWLRGDGYKVNPKRISRLLRKMGLRAIYPGPKTSKANPQHRIYPYLLRNVPIRRINQVWSSDITHVRMQRGFCCLVTGIDWFSRYPLSWEVTTRLEASFCIETLDRALMTGSDRPQAFNSDQRGQFTSLQFTDRLLAHDISISKDGRGSGLDNIFVERLWRSVKQAEV